MLFLQYEISKVLVMLFTFFKFYHDELRKNALLKIWSNQSSHFTVFIQKTVT